MNASPTIDGLTDLDAAQTLRNVMVCAASWQTKTKNTLRKDHRREFGDFLKKKILASEGKLLIRYCLRLQVRLSDWIIHNLPYTLFDIQNGKEVSKAEIDKIMANVMLLAIEIERLAAKRVPIDGQTSENGAVAVATPAKLREPSELLARKSVAAMWGWSRNRVDEELKRRRIGYVGNKGEKLRLDLADLSADERRRYDSIMETKRRNLINRERR